MAKDHGIPLMRPLLPTASEIVPYLERIDSARWYANNGPLLREFESRLARHFGVSDRCLVCVCNATVGLTLMLMNVGASPGSLCLMPSWTFAATPSAAIAAGLEPWFVDVSERTWSLDPDFVREILPQAPGPVGAIMPVSPFGAPLDVQAWNAFGEESGIAVAFDMAAGFDSFRVGTAPAAVSLGATKIFGIGEGGFVATTDEAFANLVRLSGKYGFATERRSEFVGTNAKMSEYAAAVGMAALDGWAAHRSAFRAVTETYLDRLADVPNVEVQPGLGAGWYSSFFNVRVRGVSADRVIDELTRRGIGARKWWSDGCHRQPAFTEFAKTDLPVTDALAASIVGLPISADLSSEDIDIVCRALNEILGR